MSFILPADRVYDIIRKQRQQRSPGRAPGAPGLHALVLGGGGREYAIAWAPARSKSVATIDAIPGNAGMALFTRLVADRDRGAEREPHRVRRVIQAAGDDRVRSDAYSRL